jgi:hypothetical protein
MHRRDFIAVAGAGTLATMAGCSSALGSVAAPTVPTDPLESGGWVQREESQETVFEESYGPITLEAKSQTLVYGNQALRSEIREKTLGRVDGQMAMFAATRIGFSPNLADIPGDIGTKTIIDQTETAARTQFVSQMETAGLADVQQTDTGTLTVDTGEDARLTTYEAAFAVDAVSFPVTDEQSVALPESSICRRRPGSMETRGVGSGRRRCVSGRERRSNGDREPVRRDLGDGRYRPRT